MLRHGVGASRDGGEKVDDGRLLGHLVRLVLADGVGGRLGRRRVGCGEKPTQEAQFPFETYNVAVVVDLNGLPRKALVSFAAEAAYWAQSFLITDLKLVDRSEHGVAQGSILLLIHEIHQILGLLALGPEDGVHGGVLEHGGGLAELVPNAVHGLEEEVEFLFDSLVRLRHVVADLGEQAVLVGDGLFEEDGLGA